MARSKRYGLRPPLDGFLAVERIISPEECNSMLNEARQRGDFEAFGSLVDMLDLQGSIQPGIDETLYQMWQVEKSGCKQDTINYHKNQ